MKLESEILLVLVLLLLLIIFGIKGKILFLWDKFKGVDWFNIGAKDNLWCKGVAGTLLITFEELFGKGKEFVKDICLFKVGLVEEIDVLVVILSIEGKEKVLKFEEFEVLFKLKIFGFEINELLSDDSVEDNKIEDKGGNETFLLVLLFGCFIGVSLIVDTSILLWIMFVKIY